MGKHAQYHLQNPQKNKSKTTKGEVSTLYSKTLDFSYWSNSNVGHPK